MLFSRIFPNILFFITSIYSIIICYYCTFQASIRYARQNYPFCGGTVINPTHILTAAHCMVTSDGNVISRTSIIVVVGDLRTDSPTSNTLSRDVLEIIVHENYSTTTLENDIALLKVGTNLVAFWLIANDVINTPVQDCVMRWKWMCIHGKLLISYQYYYTLFISFFTMRSYCLYDVFYLLSSG